MVSNNGEAQPQNALQPGSVDDGAADGLDIHAPNSSTAEGLGQAQPPQDGSKPAGDQTGAEQPGGDTKPTERTFSQAEVSKMTSAYQKDTQAVKQELLAANRQLATQRAAGIEAEAAAADRRAVDDGEITEAQATQLKTQRDGHRVFEAREAKLRVDEAQAEARGELNARAQTAIELAKKHGLTAPEELFNNERIVTPENMEDMAELLYRRQAMEATEAAQVGTEVYASGKTSAGAGGAASYVQKLKTGAELPSAEEIDRLTAGYLNEE